MRSALMHAAVLVVCAMVSGCGGGGKSPAPITPPPAPPLVVDDDRDSVPNESDCAPSDASRWQVLAYASVDSDGDQRRVSGAGQTCTGSTLPAGYFASSVPTAEVDCDDAAAAQWQVLAYVASDLDSDTYFTASAGSMCTGSQLPPAYSATAVPASLQDCLDTDSSRWRWTGTYSDADGDGVGSGRLEVRCVGTSPPAGFSFLGYDPLDVAGDSGSPLVADFSIQSGLLVTP